MAARKVLLAIIEKKSYWLQNSIYFPMNLFMQNLMDEKKSFWTKLYKNKNVNNFGQFVYVFYFEKKVLIKEI